MRTSVLGKIPHNCWRGAASVDWVVKGKRGGGGGGELGERERGGCCGGRGYTVVNGVGRLGFGGLPWCGSGHCCGSEEIRNLMEQKLLGWLMWR